MPSKRQPAKQRRAAENRARQAALAARSQHASQPKRAASSSSSSSSGSGKSRSGFFFGRGTPARGTGPVEVPPGWRGFVGIDAVQAREPGVRAAFTAVLFAFMSFAITPFLFKVVLDDRDKQVPPRFQGLYIGARSALTGNNVKSHSESLWAFQGPAAFGYVVLPLLVIIVAYVFFLRTRRSMPLTVGMLALAVLVMFVPGAFFFLPSVIALAVASFGVRKIEMAGRMADREAAAADSKPAADDDEEADEDLDADDEYEDDEEEDDEEDEYEDVEDDDEYEDEDEYEEEDEPKAQK